MKILEQELDIIMIQYEPDNVAQKEDTADEKKESEVLLYDDGTPPSIDSIDGDGNLLVNDNTTVEEESVEEQLVSFPSEQADSCEIQDETSNDLVDEEMGPALTPEEQSTFASPKAQTEHDEGDSSKVNFGGVPNTEEVLFG
jgi:hypothetical protein